MVVVVDVVVMEGDVDVTEKVVEVIMMEMVVEEGVVMVVEVVMVELVEVVEVVEVVMVEVVDVMMMRWRWW